MMEKMDKLILLIPVSAHGFLDFIYLDSDLKLGLYIFAIISYGLIGLQIFKDISIIFFIIFSMYHFSKDFSYLDPNENNQLIHYCMGCLVITSTVFESHSYQWYVMLNLLTTSTNVNLKIIHFLEVLCYACFYYIIINIVITKEVYYGIFIALYSKIFEDCKPLDTIIYYLTFFHVPINVYKHYTENSSATNFWFAVGIYFSSIFCIVLHKKLSIKIVQFAISVTTAHMILNSL